MREPGRRRVADTPTLAPGAPNETRLTMDRIGRHSLVAVLACTLVVTAGCDELLEVDLPSAVTSDALDDPSTAALQVNSVMANVECGYSSFAIDAAGMEDNFQMVTGVAGNYSQYDDTPGGGTCDTDVYSQEWLDPFLTARGQAYDTWENLQSYDIPNQAVLLATNAVYTAVVLDVFGEYFCESAIDAGPLLTPTQTLDVAEEWLDSAFAQITAAGGDFEIETLSGTVTTSISQMAYGLRSRIRWSKGDLAGAVADATMVSDGFMAYVLREDGEKRRNMISATQGGGGGIQAAGFLQGPVKLKETSNTYGISELDVHPVTMTPWPDTIPFTGYIDLAVDAEGRAVDDRGHPITAANMGTGGMIDPRIQTAIGNTAGGDDYIIQKYDELSDDIPLINWREMRLIQAEAQGPSAAAVNLVNDVRDADGVQPITGAYRALVESNPDRFDDMIIEERRRALWLEGRFWATKIQKNEKLWFPRDIGEWINPGATYALGGGVRLLMQEDEYQINPNLSLEDRATGCPMGERPVGPWPASPS
jgi:hypothetical protein